MEKLWEETKRRGGRRRDDDGNIFLSSPLLALLPSLSFFSLSLSLSLARAPYLSSTPTNTMTSAREVARGTGEGSGLALFYLKARTAARRSRFSDLFIRLRLVVPPLLSPLRARANNNLTPRFKLPRRLRFMLSRARQGWLSGG
jgi:hypothetical protein